MVPSGMSYYFANWEVLRKISHTLTCSLYTWESSGILLRPITWIVLGKAAMLPHAAFGGVFSLAYLDSPLCSCVPPSGMLWHSPTWIVLGKAAMLPHAAFGGVFSLAYLDSLLCSCVPPSGMLWHSTTWIVLGKAAMLPHDAFGEAFTRRPG
jgi:hypothetical protein